MDTKEPADAFVIIRDCHHDDVSPTQHRIDCEPTHEQAALRFAVDDHAGWHNEKYNELLWVRRIAPFSEPSPGRAIRVTLYRDSEAEGAWYIDD